MHRQAPEAPSFRILKQFRPGRNRPRRNLAVFPHTLAPKPTFPEPGTNGKFGYRADLGSGSADVPIGLLHLRWPMDPFLNSAGRKELLITKILDATPELEPGSKLLRFDIVLYKG